MPAVELLKRPLRPGLRRFRSATARQRILPSFLVLGSQRAGTSTLFFHLRQHPEISGPRGAEKSVDWPKELHFFDAKFGRGVDRYRAFFPFEASRSLARRRGRDRIAGEATPNYLFHPQAPPRAAEVLSGGRLIALLRRSIDRALGAELAEHFAESNRRLARLLGRDLGWDDVTGTAPR